MKILHINTSDTAGGAAIAAMRLHKAMLAAGIDSTFFCLNRTINDDERILTVDKKTKMKTRTVDLAQQMLFRKAVLSDARGLFSNMKLGYKLSKFVNLDDYDVIYIHWVNGGFLSLKGLEEICKTGKKIFWFMHDMFPITGGCHHSFDCKRYTQNCGECPYMKHSCKSDFSYKQLKLKHKTLEKYPNLSFISPSKWLYECTKSSSLAKGHNVYHIPNLLDPAVFRPLEKDFCREVLNLPKDKKIILFGADSALTNPYKGFEYLVKAMGKFKTDSHIKADELLLVIFGSSYNKTIDDLLPFETRFMGALHDGIAISLLYNSASVFCIPSVAENFANTILEAINCHTPVVGFNVGGIPDIVGTDTGYLAEYKNADDFAKGISYVLDNENTFTFKKLEEIKVEDLLKKHEKLFTGLEVKDVWGGYISIALSQKSLRICANIQARRLLGLRPDRRYLLFGADSALTNPYKGFEYLVKALNLLKQKEQYNDIELIVFGSSKNESIEQKLPYPCHFFGYLHDVYALNLLYNAADVFCMPSLAEAFGQTALESVFCGTSVVAFDVGGLPDFVLEKTGYLAKYEDVEDFACGVELCLQLDRIDNELVIGACSSAKIIKQHEAVWKSL